MSKIISNCRLGAVAGLLGFAVLTLSSSATAVNALPPQPTPTIVPEGQDGELDHTFGANDGDGVDGLTQFDTYSMGSVSLFLRGTAVQQVDGKIVGLTTPPQVAEQTNLAVRKFTANIADRFDIASGPNLRSTLFRINYDGTLDMSFAQDGYVPIDDLLGGETLLTAISMQVDGKILVSGFTYPVVGQTNEVNNSVDSAANYGFSGKQFLLRILSDGSPDQSFGNSGVVQVSDGQDDQLDGYFSGFPTDLTIQNDGRIILSGFYEIDNEIKYFITRFDVNGIVDNSFGESGIYIDRSGIDDPFSNSVFQQTDGKIVSIGIGHDESQRPSFYAFRLTTDGMIDPTYGEGGVFSFLDTEENFYPRAVIQSDNQIVFAENYHGTQVSIRRISKDGTVDQSFGTDGELLIGDGISETYIFDLTIQADGKIVATGTRKDLNEISYVLDSFRFLKDGSPDKTFGFEGVVAFDLAPDLVGTQVIVQPNGQLVIMGFQADEQYDFALRLNSATPVSVNGVTPSRLFDTRAGSPQGSIIVDQTTYGESKELRVKVAGMSGLPEYGIGAVTINLTATEPENNGYITVYPCGTRPETSNLTFVKDQTVSTSVTTAVSPTGEFCVYSSVQTNLIADINSWSAPNAGYAPLAPQRLVDTRASSPQGAITVQKKKYGADSELRITVAGAAGLPRALMSSVSLNITVTEPENSGFLTVYPCGTLPLASNLNYVAGQTISTSVISAVSDDGEICIYSSSPTNLIADAYGWFVQGSGVTPVGPTRLVDTRTASPQGAISVTQKKYGATDELRLPLNGVAGLPDDGLGTVQLTVTADQPNASGFITVYPCGTLPLASNLNYTTGKTVAATVTTQVSTDGEICIYSNQPTNIIVDINGWGNQPQYRCGGNILKTPDAKHGTISAC